MTVGIGHYIICREKGIFMDTLCYGDNLDILHEHIADETIDLINSDMARGDLNFKKAKKRKIISRSCLSDSPY